MKRTYKIENVVLNANTLSLTFADLKLNIFTLRCFKGKSITFRKVVSSGFFRILKDILSVRDPEKKKAFYKISYSES